MPFDGSGEPYHEQPSVQNPFAPNREPGIPGEDVRPPGEELPAAEDPNKTQPHHAQPSGAFAAPQDTTPMTTVNGVQFNIAGQRISGFNPYPTPLHNQAMGLGSKSKKKKKKTGKNAANAVGPVLPSSLSGPALPTPPVPSPVSSSAPAKSFQGPSTAGQPKADQSVVSNVSNWPESLK